MINILQAIQHALQNQQQNIQQHLQNLLLLQSNNPMNAAGLPSTNPPQLPPPPPAPFMGINQVGLVNTCVTFSIYKHISKSAQYYRMFCNHFQGLQGFLNVRNNLGATSLSPSTSHINGIPHQRSPMLAGSRAPGGIPQVLPPPHFPPHHQRPPPSTNPPVGLLGNSSQMQVSFYSGIYSLTSLFRQRSINV